MPASRDVPRGLGHLIALLFLLVPALAVAADDAPLNKAIPVEAKPLRELAVHVERRAPASVVSENDSRLDAEVTASIRSLRVRVGDTVKAGALLVELDDRDLRLAEQRERAALAALQADLELAQYQLERARTLARRQAVSDELLHQRQAAVATLQARSDGQRAALAQAQRNLAKTQLRAPFAGLVRERLGQVGELARPGSPLLRLTDLEHLEVSAQLATALADSLPERVTLQANGRRYPLRLRQLLHTVDPRARTREARLRFVDETAAVGSAGEIVWRDPRAAIPAALLLRREGKLGVMVVEAGRARFVPLAGAIEGRPAPTELPPETRLITAGRYRLRGGETVSLNP